MPPDSKPKKTGWLRSRFRRLFSSSSGARNGGDGEPIARDLQALVPDPSLPDNSKGLTPSSEEESHVPTVGPERGSARAIAKNVPSSMGPSASMSMFSKAHHFNIGGSIQIISPQHAADKSIDGWKTLLENIAPNAFYNSRARFDAPKCDEDTRVEVIGELMDWMNDRDGPQRLLCMTGAAGAGKSSLQQTVAEGCSKSGILGSAFFFSSQDPTRNNLSRIIPTIAFQLGQKDPTLRDFISKAIEEDPPIFEKTIGTQMDTLIVRPFEQLCANGGFDPSKFPHAVLIDGLDECSGEESQAELLSSIKDCLLDNDLPFRILIASRPEWAIRSALGSEARGYLHPLAYHIQLSDKYDATNDLRRFLWRRLQDIGSRSHDPRARSRSWPRAEDIEKLVRAASGQFVYAATVVKYVSERRTSPVDRLQTVVDWTPEEGQLARPFEALDMLYTRILTAAKESYEAIDTNRGRNFLLLLKAHQINALRRVGGTAYYAHVFDAILSLERGAHDGLVSDLHSLVVFHPLPGLPDFFKMHFYHQSFAEFLDSKTRAKNLFISEIQVKAYILEVVLQGINQVSLEPSSTSATSGSWFKKIVLGVLTLYSDKGEALSGQQILGLAQNDGWRKFDQLVPKGHLFALEQFLLMISVIIGRLKDELKEPGLADALKIYYNKWTEVIETLERQAQQDAENF